MAAFGGWEMPVAYTSIVEEHRAVRERVGLFDVSHMGQVTAAGPGIEPFLDEMLTNNVRKSSAGRAQYTFLCNQDGGIADDLVLYWLEPSRFLLLVNAGNTDADFDWLRRHAPPGVRVRNLAGEIGAVAVQGPLAAKLLPMAAGLEMFHIGLFDVCECRCHVARTGYTGEDGFEVFCAADELARLWNALLECGKEFGIRPCGLGARDTLRTEACLPLHGQDITPATTPLEAGLGKFVAFEKDGFIGREALRLQKEQGVTRKLVAFRMTGKSPPPRPHYKLFAGGRQVGEVTSGTHSPSLEIGIGLGYVERASSRPGTQISVEIRDRQYQAVIAHKPLYRRPI